MCARQPVFESEVGAPPCPMLALHHVPSLLLLTSPWLNSDTSLPQSIHDLLPQNVQGNESEQKTLQDLNPDVQAFVTTKLMPLYQSRGDNFCCTLEEGCNAAPVWWATVLVPQWKEKASAEACATRWMTGTLLGFPLTPLATLPPLLASRELFRPWSLKPPL